MAAALLLAATAGCGSKNSSNPPPPNGVAPVDFVAQVDNPWFPLRPGTTLRYLGETDGEPGFDVFRVTDRKKRILGVDATVVHDQVILGGRVVEDTLDYYAQDARGNVWYLGEDTKELDRHGRVKSRSGTWRAGVDGAKAGIFMPAHPRVGQSFRQEYYKGEAEDHFRVVSVRGDRLNTHEWTPLEPGVLDLKQYKRGVGTVLERTLKGGDELWKLQSVQTAR